MVGNPPDTSRFKIQPRSGGMVSDRFKRRMQGLNESRGLYDDKLLLTDANALRIKGISGHYYAFHRDLAAEDASPQDQQTLLRRVRRAVYNTQLADQQLQNVSAMLDEWKSNNPPGSKHPFYEKNPEGLRAIEIENLRSDSESIEMLFQGLEFAWDHEAEIKAILKRNFTMDDAFIIGQELTALSWIEELREQAAHPVLIDKQAEDKAIYQLRQNAKVMPLETQELYRQLEIPLVLEKPLGRGSGRATVANGSFSVTPAEKRQVGYAFDHRYIAGHELCHQLMGHDFEYGAFRNHHSNKFAAPPDIAAAAQEYQGRMDRIIARDPEIIKEWKESYGGDMQVFDHLHDTLTALKGRSQNERSKKYYAEKGFGWEYEQISNYFGMRQAVFTDAPETMWFVSPKAYMLCDRLEENTHLQQEQIREINNYYSNPERDAIFALIQRDNPQISMPTGLSRGD